MTFDAARAVADAVLFEGYALYPYRPSSRKNVSRWQFGVLAPRVFAEVDGGDPWWMETECLLEPREDVRVRGLLRFLRLRRRQVLAPGPVDAMEYGGQRFASWDEGELTEIEVEASVEGGQASFELAGDVEVEPIDGGCVERRRSELAGTVRCTLERVEAEQPCVRLRVRVENVTRWEPGATRDEAMAASMLSAHLLLCAEGGEFISLLDPPTWAEGAAGACRNVRVYPVLAGDRGKRDLVLASPIILYDYPEVAPESPGDLYDATEIDEILLLRTRAMTPDEKREACAADPRIAALVARADAMSPESMERLHGTFRALRPDGHPTGRAPAGPRIEGFGPGDRVRLHPGGRRADAQDMFVEGRTATVRSVLRDVGGRVCLAVTVDDDPAAELYLERGLYQYFYADEVEPLVTSS